jgi:hypothetical protein
MSENNKEVRIVNNKYAIPAAVPQYTPRRTRASEIGSPRLINPLRIYEIGKVARNTPTTAKTLFRCKPAPYYPSELPNYLAFSSERSIGKAN